MQVTPGTAVGVDLDRVRPVLNVGKHLPPTVNNVKSKGFHGSFTVNTRRDLGHTKGPFNLIFLLE